MDTTIFLRKEKTPENLLPEVKLGLSSLLLLLHILTLKENTLYRTPDKITSPPVTKTVRSSKRLKHRTGSALA